MHIEKTEVSGSSTLNRYEKDEFDLFAGTFTIVVAVYGGRSRKDGHREEGKSVVVRRASTSAVKGGRRGDLRVKRERDGERSGRKRE